MTPLGSLALNRLPCGWLSLDGSGNIAAVNAALCHMLGSDAQSLQGKPFDSLLTRASRVLFQSYLQPMLHLHGNVEEFSLTFDLGSGQALQALVYSANAAPGQTSQIELVVASQRRRRAIEEEMLRIKRAADHAPGMIFQLVQMPDGSCHFPYTSEAIRRMYGITSQQASESPQHLLSLMNAATRASIGQQLHAAARDGRDWSGIFEVNLPGMASRWHEAQATPRRLTQGITLWHGHVADVTDRRALELAMADKLALERMHQARNEFLARVSHELRTPLNGILGFARLLSTDKAENLSPEQCDRLAVLASSGRHLLELVNEVLEVTTIESGQLHVELQPVELLPRLEHALLAVAEQAEQAHVRILPLDCPPHCWVRSNEQRLHQILVNLLSNAIKYNRVDGTVQVVAQHSPEGLRVSVIDSGRGMSAEQLAGLFQPFNRLGAENSPIAGSGLGLVITKQLATLMGADLSVHSDLGVGSQFSILLAACDRPQPPAVESSAVIATAPESAGPARIDTTQVSGSVLYVEDDEVNAILMTAVLGMRPRVKVEVSTTGAQALQMAQRHRPDLLLIDMHLPDTNGIELLARLRNVEGLASVPAIMVSAGARSLDIDSALSAGFTGYWTKPLDIDKTLAELDRALGQATHAAP